MAKVSQDGCTTPPRAVPAPATSTPPGSSHGSERRSARWPNSGWINDEVIVIASTSTSTEAAA